MPALSKKNRVRWRLHSNYIQELPYLDSGRSGDAKGDAYFTSSERPINEQRIGGRCSDSERGESDQDVASSLGDDCGAKIGFKKPESPVRRLGLRQICQDTYLAPSSAYGVAWTTSPRRSQLSYLATNEKLKTDPGSHPNSGPNTF
jgi:hypothetical protein